MDVTFLKEVLVRRLKGREGNGKGKPSRSHLPSRAQRRKELPGAIGERYLDFIFSKMRGEVVQR